MSGKSENTVHPLPASRAMLENLAGCLTGQWDELLRLRLAVVDRFDEQNIHDLRVASRRLRSVIELLEPCIGKELIKSMRRPVRRLTAEIGQMRNLDEARLFFFELKDKSLTPLTDEIEQQRSKEARRIRRMLEELPCNHLEKMVCAARASIVTADNIASGIMGWLSERNLSLYRPIHAQLQLDLLSGLPTERHTLRIAVKKWRYFNEQLALLCGSESALLLLRLKEYQGLLGELNDLDVFSGMLQDCGEIPPPDRERIQAVIAGKYRQLLDKFRKLLSGKPLRYQFLA